SSAELPLPGLGKLLPCNWPSELKRFPSAKLGLSGGGQLDAGRAGRILRIRVDLSVREQPVFQAPDPADRHVAQATLLAARDDPAGAGAGAGRSRRSTSKAASSTSSPPTNASRAASTRVIAAAGLDAPSRYSLRRASPNRCSVPRASITPSV